MADTTVPKTRIKGVQEARDLFQNLWTRDEQARKFRAQGRNQVEGGLPMDPLELKRQGRAWEFNSNMGAARADFEKAHLPYFRMVNEMPRKASVTIWSDKPHKARYQAAFEVCFDRFLRDWGQNYVFQYLALTTDHVGWGVGTFYFDKKQSPRWKTVNRGDVLLPRRAPHEASQNAIVGLRQSFSLSELYGHISGASHSAGWNERPIRNAVTRALQNGGMDVSTTKPGDWERVQNRIRDNDLGVSGRCDMIDCGTLLVQEFDGSITRLIFEENQPTPDGDKSDSYLYEEKGFAKSMEQAIGFVIFEAPLGERTFHGIKGQITKNYTHARTENRMWARILNAAHFGLSMNFVGGSTSVQGYPVTNFGNVNVFREGMTQQQYYPQLGTAIPLMQMLQQNKSENLTAYRRSSTEIANTDTATAAKLAAGMDAQFNQATAALFLAQISDLMTEQFRRLRTKGSDDPDAKRFVERLQRMGVPDSCIYEDDITVATSASAGAAAPWNRSQDLAEWGSNRGSRLFNERWYMETMAAHKFGPDAVDKAVLGDSDPSDLQERRIAIMENATLATGVPLDALPQDDPLQHLKAHIEPLAQIVQSFMKSGQVDPQRAVAAQMIRGHADGHLNIMAADESKTPEFKQIKQAFSQIDGPLMNMFKSLQQSQPQQPQPNGPVS